MNCEAGDLALVLAEPDRVHESTSALYGSIVSVVAFLGDFIQLLDSDRVVRTRDAWMVRSALYPNDDLIVADRALRPIRGKKTTTLTLKKARV